MKSQRQARIQYNLYLLGASSSNVFQNQSNTETSGTIRVDEPFRASSGTKNTR